MSSSTSGDRKNPMPKRKQRRKYAIPSLKTIWNGVEFRSRLEARWALVFHLLGMPFIYEPPHMTIPGVPYLPDFYLPVSHSIIEIKPSTPSQEELDKLLLYTKRHPSSFLLKSSYLFTGIAHESPVYAVENKTDPSAKRRSLIPTLKEVIKLQGSRKEPSPITISNALTMARYYTFS